MTREVAFDRKIPVQSGKCGDNVNYVLDDNGTLIISGTGPMENYSDLDDYRDPWFQSRSTIKKIVIENGVTSIGHGAFLECESLTDVYYEGSEADKAKINIDKLDEGNDPRLNATWHYNDVKNKPATPEHPKFSDVVEGARYYDAVA